MSNESIVKRLLTEEAYNQKTAHQAVNSKVLSDDLTARLQNIGSRVRKNVTEGYATSKMSVMPAIQRTLPTTATLSSPSMPTTPFPPLFQSSNDILHQVFSSPSVSASSSPRKRVRSASDDDLPSPQHDNDGDENMSSIDNVSTNHDRVIKPLPTPTRLFAKTRSLPVGNLRFQGQHHVFQHPKFDHDMRDALSDGSHEEWTLSDFKPTHGDVNSGT